MVVSTLQILFTFVIPCTLCLFPNFISIWFQEWLLIQLCNPLHFWAFPQQCVLIFLLNDDDHLIHTCRCLFLRRNFYYCMSLGGKTQNSPACTFCLDVSLCCAALFCHYSFVVCDGTLFRSFLCQGCKMLLSLAEFLLFLVRVLCIWTLIFAPDIE